MVDGPVKMRRACSSCGQPLVGDEVYCPKCGHRLVSIPEALPLETILETCTRAAKEKIASEPVPPCGDACRGHDWEYDDCSGYLFEDVCDGCEKRTVGKGVEKPSAPTCILGKSYRDRMDAFGCEHYEDGYCTGTVLTSYPPKYHRCPVCQACVPEYVECGKLRRTASHRPQVRDDF